MVEELKAKYRLETIVVAHWMLVLERLSALQGEVEQAQAEWEAVAALPQCSGNANWVDSEAYAAPYLYAIHGTGKACPMHGEPPPGGRIRKGIGTNAEKQTAVIDAMSNWRAAEKAQAKLEKAKMRYDKQYGRMRELMR